MVLDREKIEINVCKIGAEFSRKACPKSKNVIWKTSKNISPKVSTQERNKPG
jgi:hypothetical protein